MYVVHHVAHQESHCRFAAGIDIDVIGRQLDGGWAPMRPGEKFGLLPFVSFLFCLLSWPVASLGTVLGIALTRNLLGSYCSGWLAWAT